MPAPAADLLNVAPLQGAIALGDLVEDEMCIGVFDMVTELP
jgi:hypothetical protein